ncbi:hypothetical protein N0V84_006465 [Fusarium piperis]|uniref:Uncharacterized protein n=1 Tax=Fusarium piperis TaxID=1435070 RepID=A0A9W8WBX5_9HYPO|nr:hypothetical protein N0V84_006465 [Fusarium piperis]
MAPLHLWLAICHARDEGSARHWILILAEEGAHNGTWYHSTGGPTMNKPYKVEIQTKRVNSHGIDSHHSIAEISDKHKNKVKAAVQAISPKFCQRWTVDVLAELERKGLVPNGTSANWYLAMENDPYSDDGAPSIQYDFAGPSS